VAEALDLQPAEFIPPTYWMERGINLEPEARGWFQVETGMPVRKAGFIEHESGLAGISPDGYVDGAVDSKLAGLSSVDQKFVVLPVELKCPKPGTHIQWLMAGGMPKKHLPQCHFQMVITGAPYMYFMSYHPTVEALLIKVERDEYTESLSIMLDAAIMTLREAIDKYTPKENEDG
jgi:exodeoxyribonuclease (lambda-induced)